MSVINKLLIKGIRSFSPDNDVALTFQQPLTVIVGQNGAGKTTVIECLKMATTGSLPPNTRSGQNFIHDPKVANESEVKGQIKLRFRTAQRSDVVCTRSFQLTQNKSSLKYKALDQTIRTINQQTRETEAVSHRCVDMDRIVPQIMGVSKAILENVVFVHQEESNWPLEEGAVLKKKFDDIFSATKYTKALEALQKLRKEQNQAVHVMQLEMLTLQAHMDQAIKYREKVSAGEKNVEELQHEIDDLREQTKVKEEKGDALDKKLEQLESICAEISAVSSKLEVKQQQSEVMLSELGDEPDKDIEWIEDKMTALQAKIDSSTQATTGLGETLDKHIGELRAARQEHSDSVEMHGRLKAEAEFHQSTLIKRDSLLREMASKTGMMSLPTDGALEPSVVDVFTEAIQQKVDYLEQSLVNIKRQSRSADEAASEKLTRVETDIATHRQAVVSKKRAAERLEAYLIKLESEHARIVMSDDMLRQRDEDLDRCKAELASTQHRAEAADFDGKLRNLGRIIDEVGHNVSVLREERKTVEAASEYSTRLRIKTREMQESKDKAQALMDARRRDLLKLLGAAELPPMESLREVVEQQVKRCRGEAERLAVAKEEAQRKMASCAGKKDSTDQQLKRLQDQAGKLWQQVLSGLDGAARLTVEQDKKLDAVIAQRSSNKEAKETHLNQLEATSKVLGAIVAAAKEKNVCDMCGRGFCSAMEKQSFLNRQDDQMHMLPMAIEREKAELATAADSLEAVAKLQPLWVAYENARKDVPELESRVGVLAAELQEITELCNEAINQHEAAKQELTRMSSLLEEVALPVDNISKQAAQQTEEVARLERLMHGSQAARTVHDVTVDLEALEREQERLRREKDEVAREKDALGRDIDNKKSNMFSARDEAQRAHTLKRDKDKLHAQIEEADAEHKSLQEELQGLEARALPLQNERNEVMGGREAQRKQAVQAEIAAESDLREFKDMADSLARLCGPIREYIKRGRAGKVEAAAAKIEQLQMRIAELEMAVKEVEGRLNSSQEEILKREHAMRALKDAAQYKRSRLEEDEFRRQLEKLNAEAAEVGDRDVMLDELQQLQADISRVKGMQDMKRGSISTEKAAIREAQKNLKEPNYLSIDERCRTKQIQQKTTEMASHDLARYHKALEKALQTYHTNKMADINKIVKELWQKTYRNQDIDYIMIKSDANGQKSYNYRVVMMCKDAELDMRGRCSAGQKVLACLIIRLALAETFCLNCGILALDEPTTNLDAANSASLAEALRCLMNDRQGQENFQMIIITHDETFASLIGTREFVDHRWRVTKDENQHSHLETEVIQE
mmetsp:Transcript_10117/g.29059  ORF Transcript_10117/g.29059 Transcript_10117/m.29059 type:complete len:1316 (-) Transcript_10117:363-4310(-)